MWINRKIFAVFWFIVVEICLAENALQLPCENVSVHNFKTHTTKKCMMQETTSIYSEGVTILQKDATMTALYFRGNENIRFLPVQVSDSFPNLLEYDASWCSVTKISKSNFERMNLLKLLHLYDNEISIINSNTFEDLTTLETLTLCKKILDKYWTYPLTTWKDKLS